MSNVGKIFEEDFKVSIPKEILVYRLPDNLSGIGGSNKLRFTKKNPFDYLLWSPKERELYALELKTVKGKSISFERTKEEKREIHYHQIKGLTEWSNYDGIVAGFVINFREAEKTVFIPIKAFNELVEKIDKSSINIDDLEEYSVPYVVIPQKKKRTRYRYDLTKFFEDKNMV